MHTREVTLSDILSSHRQHIIPVFQRAYSWTQKHWKELWSDIEMLTREGNEQLEHFMGPIIIDKGETGSYVPEKYLVIDGQQRLVTLSTLLCVLRDLAIRHNDEAFASSVLPFLSFKTPRGEAHDRLVPRSADRTAFQSVIGKSLTKEHNKLQIVKAYRYFFREIRKTLPSNGGAVADHLNQLFEVVVARLKFVSITLEKPDDPTRIYESMNSKGKDLLVADLIRNYVIMNLSVDRQDEFFDTQWEKFEQQFAQSKDILPDSKELEDFYYRFLISKRDYFAKRLVYAEYKEHMSGFFTPNDPDDILFSSLGELVAEQERYATYYRRIIHPELEPDPGLREAFYRFSFLDALTATPFIMSLYARYDKFTETTHIDKRTFLDMLNAVESFIIRRSILRLRTRGYGLDFAQAVRKSHTLEELWQHFEDREWPTDDQIGEALIEFPLYLRERKKARLILEQLEESFGHKEQVDLSDHERIQIEHIIPQKKDLSPDWQEMLGEDAQEIHAKYHQTLGNLTLTGYNQQLGTKSFHEKKLEYTKHGTGSHLELNAFVLDQEQWSKTEIVARTEDLTKKLLAIWPRPNSARLSHSELS